MIATQLLFIEETREEKLAREVERLSIQLEKIRKGQYAEIGSLKKMYSQINNDLEMLKIAICKGNI